MSERAEATIRIKLSSPFAFQGLAPSAFGIDVSLVRGGDSDARVMLPGTLLRGNLRAALEAIATRCPMIVTAGEIDCWFGQPSEEGGDDEPSRSLVDIDDLLAMTAEPPAAGSYYRIAIDDERASVRHGALQIIELPWPIGAEVVFEGRVVFLMEAAARAKLHRALELALGALPTLGAFKSAGFGQVLQTELGLPTEVRSLALTPTTYTKLDDEVEVVLKLDRPFLVDAKRVADNIFRGNPVIPGAVLKGAIARRAELAGNKVQAFDAALATIVFGHGFPVPAAKPNQPQPCPLPLSLVSVEQRQGSGTSHRLRDVLLPGPCLFGGKAAHFQGWKPRAWPRPDPRELCGWSDDPGYMTRIRTAVEGDSWAASEAQLFAHAAVRPDKHLWHFRIARNGADQSIFTRILGAIEQGVDGIGRTKARAICKQMRKALPPAISPLPDGSTTPRYAVTLQTEALLNCPAALRKAVTLQQDYADYWRDASNGRLQLTRYFARQRLAGGYIATRFRLDPARYDPFLVTEVGSVFLLEGDAADLLRTWSVTGLPLPSWLKRLARWTNCPYLPENGYGAIRVNLVDHVGLAEDADVI